jgi:DNA-binding transcriptional LysR family regulator
MATPDLNHLSVFVAVAQTGSFTGAAKKLGVPKSTVSRAIAALEDAMDVRLIHRTTRKVSLSTTGSAVYERVAPALSTLQTSLGNLPELEDAPSGDLRITAAIDFGATVLAELVTRFTARYPAVRVDVWLSNRVVDLVAEGFDLAFRVSTSARLKDSSLTMQKASPLALQLFASPSYLARRGTPRAPGELAGHDWVVYRGAGALRLESGSEVATVAPAAGHIQCDDMFFTRSALRAGAGIGMLPSFVVDEDLASGQLVRVLSRWDMRSGYLWIAAPGGKHPPRKVAAFRSFALEALRSRPLVT